MNVKTKKYKLETKTYVRIGMMGVVRKQWWVGLIVLALCSMTFLLPSIWWVIGTLIALVLYLLFWLIQFYGLPQLEQNKFLFERLSYEINSKQILMKLNPRQGMPIGWDKIKRARVTGDDITLYLSKVQVIHLPKKIFNTDNERKFVESILRRKGYLKANEEAVATAKK
ncbi:MAG: YcxB family protein [Bacteroidota bacterium]